MPKYAFFQGKIVPVADAKVSIMNHALNYGTGIFEGLRAYWTAEHEQLYVFRMREHYERLHRSARLLRIQFNLSPEQMCDATLDLLRCENYRTDTYIRPLGYKTDEIIGVRCHNLHDDFAIWATPFGKYVENEEGAKACVSNWRRNDDNAIPARAKITGSYVNSALIKSDAQLAGFDEAIVLNQDGHVSEGSAENFFMVRNGALITPPATANILEGITRDTVMILARQELGIDVVERQIDRSELYISDEAFFVGTGCQVAAIASIDHRPVGSGIMGPVTRRLRDLYFHVVRGDVEKYATWRTPVYEK